MTWTRDELLAARAGVSNWGETRGRAGRPVTQADLARAVEIVAFVYDVATADITGRSTRFSRMRHVSWWLLNAKGYQTAAVAQAMGWDHSGVIRAIREIDEERDADPEFAVSLGRMMGVLVDDAEPIPTEDRFPNVWVTAADLRTIAENENAVIAPGAVAGVRNPPTGGEVLVEVRVADLDQVAPPS